MKFGSAFYLYKSSHVAAQAQLQMRQCPLHCWLLLAVSTAGCATLTDNMLMAQGKHCSSWQLPSHMPSACP